MTNKFDMDEAIKDLRAGKDLSGKDSVLGPLICRFSEVSGKVLSITSLSPSCFQKPATKP